MIYMHKQKLGVSMGFDDAFSGFTSVRPGLVPINRKCFDEVSLW